MYFKQVLFRKTSETSLFCFYICVKKLTCEEGYFGGNIDTNKLFSY